MVQVTRGAAFPMVTVRTRLPESASSTTFHSSSPRQGNEIRVSGTIPATLADFKIDPPTLLTMPVKNEIPARVERLNRHGNKEVALCVVADTFPARRMASPVGLVKRVRHMIDQRVLLEDPLALSQSQTWENQRQ